MKALIIGVKALFSLERYGFDEDWFSSFDLPKEEHSIKRVMVGDCLYLLEDGMQSENDPVIVISMGGSDPFFGSRNDNVNSLVRLMTVARSVFTKAVKIPQNWKPYFQKSRVSIYSERRGRGAGARLNFDTCPDGNHDLFAFSHTDGIVGFEVIHYDIDTYRSAKINLIDALLTEGPEAQQANAAGIILLEGKLPHGFSYETSIEDWYDSKLTIAQRQFVDKPYDGPVRLRGAAGTGKTVSLVVKLIRDAQQYESAGRAFRFLFLTHNQGTVNLISAIGEQLDRAGLMLGGGRFVQIEVRTLYDLASEYLRVATGDVKPLSLDGHEGRKLQFELIEAVLKGMNDLQVVRAQFSDITQDLRVRWSHAVAGQDRRFIAEVMNEFASILDGEGIRSGELKGERYIRGNIHRAPWLLQLPLEDDRRFLLDIHRRYRVLLSEMNTLSVDQMTADFNSHLDSNIWTHLRDRIGYNALFVDELHLFTSIERDLLHKLVRRSVDSDGRPMRPPIFMAYDLKQSPSDVFLQGDEVGNQLFSLSSGLQNSELVRLDKVFRYTPQIAEFLVDLDSSFPAIDISDDWESLSAESSMSDDSVPELTIYRDDVSLFRGVMERAALDARRLSGGGRRVAVLCSSHDIFSRYLPIVSGQFEGSVFPVFDRDSSLNVRHAGKRFIFGMPEYVAGLQFHTVYLVHVDSSEAPSDAGPGLRRRFVSSVYLGASRAECHLYISSSRSRGNYSDILQLALDRGNLKMV